MMPNVKSSIIQKSEVHNRFYLSETEILVRTISSKRPETLTSEKFVSFFQGWGVYQHGTATAGWNV